MQPTTKYNKRNQSIDDTGLLYGKIPSQAVELEEAVLGAILIEKGAHLACENYLNKFKT